MRSLAILVALASCSLLLICLPARSLSGALIVTTKDTTTSETTTNEQSPKVPALFDTRQYVRSFDKHYNSELEAQTRKVYLLANALKVYNSGLAYKFRTASHHLKLNEFSDRSPLELEQMSNHVPADDLETTMQRQTLEKFAQRSGKQSVGGGESKINLLRLSEKLEHKVEETLAKHEIEANPEGRRRKRQVSSPQEPRELSMSDLIQDVRPVVERAEVRARVVSKPASNNPNYDRLALEHFSRGLIDQQEKIRLWQLNELNAADLEPGTNKAKDNGAGEDGTRGNEQVSGERAGGGTKNPFEVEQPTGLETDEDGDLIFVDAPWSLEERQPDEVFSDLRQTNCWFLPRAQGNCGSCYAFATISMMEYLYCIVNKNLVAFSEQYIIDCGKGRVKRLDGCAGGNAVFVAGFIHNFGLELAVHYPYAERELQCPYAEDFDLKKTGFMRVQLDDSSVAPMSRWAELLKYVPLYVSLAVGPNFHQYGRGVDTGLDCAEVENHGMVLIGHGREDGLEYWLLRNSYGTHWGEQGHYKLAKAATQRCIPTKLGIVFGTRDGITFARPQVNRVNPGVESYLRTLGETRASQPR